jgi:hemoglobin-like flavoprotein
MSPEARQMVKESWALAAPAAEELARGFYARLFEIDPDAARLFAATDMDAQRDKFVAMLVAIVAAVDEPRVLVADAAALGRRHAGYGAVPPHYASVGEALLQALATTLGPAFTPEVRAAWAEAYTLVAAVMRRAAGATTR